VGLKARTVSGSLANSTIAACHEEASMIFSTFGASFFLAAQTLNKAIFHLLCPGSTEDFVYCPPSYDL
jgi:hypothetical protein